MQNWQQLSVPLTVVPFKTKLQAMIQLNAPLTKALDLLTNVNDKCAIVHAFACH